MDDWETDQYNKSHHQLSETGGEVLAQFEDEIDDVVSDEEDKQQRPLKVCLGVIAVLVAFVSIADGVPVGVLLREGYPSHDQSDIELFANVVLPGVNSIYDLNRTTPQYRALEWLVYNDTHSLTIEDDATELQERFSLVTFCYALQGEDWQSNCLSSSDGPKWLNSLSHCDWCSIECDENDGSVD
eukprot:scaffold1104_cov131-Cylindrotheca_fusiformis.AAC.2